jgi:phage minor structural protein, N-terminal domain protein
LDEKVIHAQNVSAFPYSRTQVIDCSSEFDYTPSQDELRAYAVKYLADNKVGIPEISIDLDFIDLAETEEYKDVINLEYLGPGDTIRVIFDKLGVDATARIIAYEYDVLRERYEKLSIGDAKPSLAKVLISGQSLNTSTIVNAAISEINRYKRAGSKQVNLNNTSEAALLSMTELDSLFGLPFGTCTNLNTVITATNADNVNNIPVVGVTYNAGAWYIKFESAVNASVLIAYTANYYGEV